VDSIDQEADLARGPSKSEIKRDLRALQAVAERLVALPRSDLERLALGEATLAAIDETPRIRDLRARRRHLKRIAKLLAAEDKAGLTALLSEKGALTREASVRHHRLERWRERLIEEGDRALGEFLTQYPGVDRQQLRALVRSARRDREAGTPEAPRKLFRFLRQALEHSFGGGADGDLDRRP
jgi:ribosome-associated protein